MSKVIRNTKSKTIIYAAGFILAIAASVFITYLDSRNSSEDRILGTVVQNDGVSVSVDINTCLLDLTVLPEKRIPATGNWQTELEAEIFDTSDVYVDTISGTSDSSGTLSFDLCAGAITIEPGDYKFFIKGKSHLRKDYGTQTTFETVEDDLDLSGDGELVSGETSSVFDNYINALDVSPMFLNYLTSDDKQDLNQDGIVNIFDFSDQILKIYQDGECSPQDQVDNKCRY
jgi:hypothetical protein